MSKWIRNKSLLNQDKEERVDSLGTEGDRSAAMEATDEMKSTTDAIAEAWSAVRVNCKF